MNWIRIPPDIQSEEDRRKLIAERRRKMNDTLLNCPFCGGEAALETMQVRKGYEADAHCNGACLASIHTITYDTEKQAKSQATDAWNRRTPDIVHCGECEEAFKRDGIKPIGCYLHGKNGITLHQYDDFCSDGKRKEVHS